MALPQSRASPPSPPPAADILVINRALPRDLDLETPIFEGLNLAEADAAISGVVIEQNWLGTQLDESMPEQRSAFGVVVFNAIDVQITNNLIQHHEGSGVITGFRADGLQLTGNAILGNGLAGMPDAVRLEGSLAGGCDHQQPDLRQRRQRYLFVQTRRCRPNSKQQYSL